MEEATYHLPENKDVRVLITGSRDWDDYDQMFSTLQRVYASLKDRNPVLVHGAAKGADSAAAAIWTRLGGTTEAHPADWKTHQADCTPACKSRSICKRAGFARNDKMVKLGATLCVAFIKNNSKGATMCAMLADKAGIPVHKVVV